MAALPESRLRQMIDRFEQVEARMGVATDAKEIVQLSRDHAELKKIAEKAREVLSLRSQLAEAEQVIEDPGADRDFINMAIEERAEIKAKLPDIEREMQLMLLPKDRDDDGSAIIEVRAGTGGDEAALFAGDLWRMYQRYASGRGWQVELVSATEGEMGGYKEVVAQLNGSGVFGRMKFESGVHRVQRVPATETQGRIHTSTATVAVLPEADDVEVQVDDKDLQISIAASGGPGGQGVNTTNSAVQILHIPSGLIVKCQDERSQLKNKAKAMKVLKSRLLDIEKEKRDAQVSAERRGMVGTGERSQKIRTYNYAQNRVSDHRIQLTLHKLDRIMMGEIDELVTALRTHRQAALLESQGDGPRTESGS
jgi:peptide chain release factor 1